MNQNKLSSHDRPRMAVGCEFFARFRAESNVLVDKSLLIKAVLESPAQVLLITRPRRWGKSLNLNMLKTFFEVTVDKSGNPLTREQSLKYKIFAGGLVDGGYWGPQNLSPLKISYDPKAMKKLGQYPVIAINFWRASFGDDYRETKYFLTNWVIRKAYKDHPYLAKSQQLDPVDKQLFNDYLRYEELSSDQIKNGFRFLSKLLYQHFHQKVFILIDEQDSIINHCYDKFSFGEFQKVLHLLQDLIKTTFYHNPYLEKGILTGILRTKADIYTNLDNLAEHNLLNPELSEYYGFLPDELEQLLTQLSPKNSLLEIKKWYKGYHHGGQTVYNPWSIVHCLSRQRGIDTYWLDSGGTGLIDPILCSDNLQKDLQTLLENQSLTKRLDKQVDLDKIRPDETAFYSLLVFAGYLNARPIADDLYELSIPNWEIRTFYEDKLTRWVTWEKTKADESTLFSLALSLEEKKLPKFSQQLKEFWAKTTKFFGTASPEQAELFAKGFLLSLRINLAHIYNISSEEDKNIWQLTPRKGNLNQVFIFGYQIGEEGEDLPLVAKNVLQRIKARGYVNQAKQHSPTTQIFYLAWTWRREKIAVEWEEKNN